MNEVLAEIGEEDPKVELELVETPEEAQRLRFRGSPTVLLDGTDPFDDDGAAAYGLSCRVYRTPHGPAGSPTKAQLREALNGQATS